jgi:hypothetical protein
MITTQIQSSCCRMSVGYSHDDRMLPRGGSCTRQK